MTDLPPLRLPSLPALLLGVLFAAHLAVPWAPLFAQTVDDPIVPRGTVFLRLDASATNVDGTYGNDGKVPFGGAFDGHLLGSAELADLAPVADRFRLLAGEAEARVLTIGTTEARFLADERAVPLQLAYGVLDRLTLAVTVPLVRKRVETSLGLSPEGANVGRSPFASDFTDVSAFLTGAATALATATTAVNEHCTTAGELDPECVSGRALVAETDAFLDDLDEAYRTEPVFPQSGSDLGNAVAGRWLGFESQMAVWGADGPDALPLATEGVNQATFESLAVRPAWPLPGFPLETPPVHLELGDVEVSAALGLLRPSPPSPTGERDGIDVVASVVATARFATGSADSLRVVAPVEPPRGVAGFTVLAVTDVLLPRRISVLGTLEAGSSGSRTLTLLAATPDSVLRPGWSRARANWTPGSHLRVSVTPRFRFGPGLSVGLGWHFFRRGADEIDPVGSDPVPIGAFGQDAATQHRLAVELRYAAVEEPNIGSVPFPFEILLRGSQSVAGSGGAPAEARAELMVRARLRE